MKINLTGYITLATSYGLVTLNFLKGLTDLKHEVSIFENIGDGSAFGPFQPYVRDSSLLAKSFDADAPCLSIRHQFDMAPSIGRGPRIGYTFFEVNKLTKLELHHLRSLDQLIVPSKWAADVCMNSGLSLPEVCPAGYDDSVFTPVDYMPKSCIFLSIGKWEVRKQQDQIVMAFNKAFGPKDNVKLWMSCNNRFIKPFVDEKKRVYKELLKERIQLFDHFPNHGDLARIIQQSYCFVAPSLAEGWNLPLLESMGCGKFNIATNYSAHTEFCDAQSSTLIEPTALVPALDNMWFRENNETNCGEWCSYNEDDLIEAMREIYKKYQEGKTLNNNALNNARKFTWAQSSKKMIDCIQIGQLGMITQRNQNMGLYND